MISKKTILKAIGITIALIIVAISVMFYLLGVAQREKIERQRIEGETTMVQEKSWKDVITLEGTIDVELARKLGAIGMDEYNEKRDVIRNKAAGEYARENHKVIEAAAKEYIKSEIGREVEILKIDAIFPYSALNIGYQTIEEPIAGGNLMYGIQANAFTNENSFEKLNLYEYRASFVTRLYTLLHKEQLKEINMFIEREFPEYGGRETLLHGNYDPELKYFYVTSLETKDGYFDKEKDEKIYNDFIGSSDLSLENIKNIFGEEKINGIFGMNLYLKDERIVPTDDMGRAIFEELRESIYKDYLSSNPVIGITINAFLIRVNNEPIVHQVSEIYGYKKGGDIDE